MTAHSHARGPIRRPAYDVELLLDGQRRKYQLEARSLRALTDSIEVIVRGSHPADHTRVRLDDHGQVHVRVGFAAPVLAGTWAPAVEPPTNLHSSARVTAVADVLERAARDGDDIGDLLASACRQASARLALADEGLFFGGDGSAALTARRSGSWESEHVRALTDGWENER